ncbi:protein lifeguard 2 [Nilaparvata lugens]|uniref:protein lifeguard 2 n=1 Tax=Nilaparvata lugens TaxID=108931 RepID=UPI00193CAB79|nr:protein lifeguard 2 [Nilaparvata lugens]
MARQDGFYDEETYEAFSDEDVRRDFVRNVYSVLSLQLLFTTAMIALFTFSDEVQEWALDNLWVMWVGMGVFLFSYLALVCYESVRRSFPMNFIFLVLLTVGMSFIASYATLQYGTRIILITAGLTCAVCITVTIIACVCPVDITGCGGILCLIGLGVSIFSMVAMVLIVFFKMKFLILVLSGVMVALFTAYLMYDTQMIMGGKRLEMSPEEYILGSVQLYIDIIYIFIYLLPLVNACCDE